MVGRYISKSGLHVIISFYHQVKISIHHDMLICLTFLSQISKVLRGIPAIRSVTSIGSAAAKLISCPVENYKKDGRVLKGVQRGKPFPSIIK